MKVDGCLFPHKRKICLNESPRARTENERIVSKRLLEQHHGAVTFARVRKSVVGTSGAVRDRKKR